MANCPNFKTALLDCGVVAWAFLSENKAADTFTSVQRFREPDIFHLLLNSLISLAITIYTKGQVDKPREAWNRSTKLEDFF